MSRLASVPAAVLFLSAYAAPAHAGLQDQAPVPHVIRKSGGVLLESATKQVQPIYPPLAQAAHVTGSVVVEVTVDESGNVIAAGAISGHPLLRQAAVDAAKGWKFKPTNLSGIPVKVIGTITLNFGLGTNRSLTDAEEDAEKKVHENPDSAQARFDLAAAYFGAGRRAEAVQALRAAIKLNPNFEMAYRTLGEYLGFDLGKGPDPAAADALEQALRLEPHDFAAAQMLEQVYVKLNRGNEALDLAKQWIRDNPTHALAYIVLANVYSSLDRNDEAIEAIKSAQAIKSGLPLSPVHQVQAYINLGYLYEKLDRTPEAIEAFKQALNLHVDVMESDARLALGEAYLKAGDTKSAMDEYEALKSRAPGLARDLLEQIHAQKEKNGKSH